jgi:hypothetical protein
MKNDSKKVSERILLRDSDVEENFSRATVDALVGLET